MLVLLLCLLFPNPAPFAPSRHPRRSCTSFHLSFVVHQPFVQYVGLCCVPFPRQPPRTSLSTLRSVHHHLLTCFVRESTCNVRRSPRATAIAARFEARSRTCHEARVYLLRRGVSAPAGGGGQPGLLSLLSCPLALFLVDVEGVHGSRHTFHLFSGDRGEVGGMRWNLGSIPFQSTWIGR